MKNTILPLLARIAASGLASQSALAAVVTHTLPIPYRTSLEQPAAGPPAVYTPPEAEAQSAYPFDFDGDGTPEFITRWNFQGIEFHVTRADSQVITTRFEEIGANLYIFPLPPGVLIGNDPPGNTVRWGNFLPEPQPDILGLGPTVGRYGMSFVAGGGGEGYWFREWNRQLPENFDYIGVRFTLADGVHYGYLHYGYERNTGGFSPTQYAVLRGWAWETEPGRGILIVPEPSAGWLALGACCCLLRRRRRG